MKANQVDIRVGHRSNARRFAKRLRAREVRKAFKQFGEIVPAGRYNGWLS